MVLRDDKLAVSWLDSSPVFGIEPTICPQVTKAYFRVCMDLKLSVIYKELVWI